MAAPNLVNVSTITAKSVQAALTTTLTTEILANAADASVFITKSGGSPVAVASTISVPADSSLVVIDKNTSIYLEEGDNIEAGASADGDLVITINYEELS